MADFNSSLPVRTETNGDVAAKIVDGTIVSQALGVDASGRITIKLDDGTGNAITSTTSGAKQALDVFDLGLGPVTPGTVAAFSELIGGQFNTTLPTLTNGQQAAVQVDNRGRLLVTSSNFPTTLDTNYGVVGANTLRTAAQIGNATGAANFNFGTVNAQTLQVAAQVGNTTGAADFNFGTVGAQTLRSAAQIGNATGAANFNFGAVTAQTLQVAAQVGNTTGAADFNFGAASAQTLRAAALVGNATGIADFNFGTVGAQTLRAAAQIGNATGAADFNNGTTGAQTLRVAANLAVGGANVSVTNPVPVTLDTVSGTSINDYKRAISIAAGATDNHDYTVTAAKTLYLDEINSSASGKAKMEIQVETGVATGVFTTFFVQFNSTATPNMWINLANPITVAAGVRVRVVMTNKDVAAEDMYSTISGKEI